MRDRVDAIIQLPSRTWLRLSDPSRIVVSESADTVRPALDEVERLTRDFGLHAVGFLVYEAASAFGLSSHPAPNGLPLLWFGLFEPQNVRPASLSEFAGEYHLGTLHPTISQREFAKAFETIKEHLEAGETYQVNFTFKVAGEFQGDVAAFFADLAEVQRGRYGAFVRIGDWAVCSASPELFFELDGVTIRGRPMKGTARRGLTVDDDRRLRDELRESAKQQAENVMIVDMIRNDLGRISQVGSIEVPELFTVEGYPNVWQMTSLVTGRSLASLADIFAAMHPSASVTGAPKVRTMELLRTLEPSARGVYTGAIGHIPPDGNASFNVAIRTAVVDLRAGRVEFGVGSGIVWDSDATTEYEECLVKAVVLGRKPVRFELLETLRWTPDAGYFLLDRHLARMQASAEYFDYRFDAMAARAALNDAVRGENQPERVRLLLNRDGDVHAERTALGPSAGGPLRLAVAATPVDVSSVWLYHKTTMRKVYDDARAAAPMADEVVLWNSAGQITETTTANVVVELDGQRFTPPASSGLLAGTFRGELLDQGAITERVLRLDDLNAATRIWLINSVHEWRQAVLR